MQQRGFEEHWFNPWMCTKFDKDEWKRLVYQSVEDHFERCRASRMQHMSTMSQYVHVKNWGVVDNTRACFRGEVAKVGALVPERYLDDTRASA